MKKITTDDSATIRTRIIRIENCFSTKLCQTWCAGSLIASFSVILFAPALALAAAAVTESLTTWNGLVNILVAIMNKGIGTMVFLGVALYFWGISSNILKFGEETDAQTKRAYFFWGIIIIFVMVSIPGILYLLQNTLFGSEAIPTSGPGYVARCPAGDC